MLREMKNNNIHSICGLAELTEKVGPQYWIVMKHTGFLIFELMAKGVTNLVVRKVIRSS